MQNTGRPTWLILPLTIFLILVIVGVYVAAMHFSVDASRLDERHTADDRDLLYLVIHMSLLAVAFGGGYFFGRWAKHAGLGFALLVSVVLAISMFAIQAGSYAYTCNGDGENDIVRHWQC